MPDARFAPEGTWRSGVSFLRPYTAFWSNITAFSWLEGSFRFTRIYDVPAFEDRPDTDYGDYRDKAFDTKVLLLPERGPWPAIALGAQDALGGTGIFRAAYGVMSKRLGELDLTLGYGIDRIDGAFGGLRWSPRALPRWSLVAEYDAYDYKQDLGSAQSGAASYKKEGAIGIEYRSELWGAKTFYSHGEVGVTAYVQLPLEQREFVPKVDEPPPYTKINPRPTEEQWAEDPEHRARLARALVEQDFRSVSLGYENGRLQAVLTNNRISSMPRAIGRAARTMLSFAPLEVREITHHVPAGLAAGGDLHLHQHPAPAALLQRHGLARAACPYVAIEYAKPLETHARTRIARKRLRRSRSRCPRGRPAAPGRRHLRGWRRERARRDAPHPAGACGLLQRPERRLQVRALRARELQPPARAPALLPGGDQAAARSRT